MGVLLKLSLQGQTVTVTVSTKDHSPINFRLRSPSATGSDFL